MSAGSVDIEGASFRYTESDRPALTEITLSIEPGEFLLVTGPSGCGKSTLGNMINGLIPHLREGVFDGHVRVGTVDTRSSTIGDLGLHVGTVFQDPRTQFFTLDTSEEIAFGCRNHGLTRGQIAERVEMSFVAVGIPELAQRNLLDLSSGEKQKVALAACYALGPQVFLFDEPSANLDQTATTELAKILAELKQSGVTIIVLEHRLHYLMELVDRVVYLEYGQIGTVYDADEFRSLSREQLIALGLRGLNPPVLPTCLSAPAGITSQRTYTSASGCTLTCDGISFRHEARRNPSITPDTGATSPKGLENITLTMSAGEIIGINGVNGAGKTTFARICAGLVKEQAGRLLLNGTAISPRERRGRIYLVVQDSGYQLFSDSVLGELRLGQSKVSAATEDTNKSILVQLGLWEHRYVHPAALSRGQQQRLTIATALASNADVLIFDEPSSGLDYRSMIAVADLLRQLAKKGKIVVVITHDTEFLTACCTRLVTIEQGQVGADVQLGQSAFQTTEMGADKQ